MQMNLAVQLLVAAVALAVSTPGSAQQPEFRATLEQVRGAETDSSISLRVAIRVTPGWHIGAPRPGAIGVPTTLDWQLPRGWTLISENWPAPRREAIGRDSAFTYSGSLNVEAAMRKGEGRGPIEVDLSYGICSKDLCIPGRKTLRYRP
jgi:DsbC/DsbD-like thiol-disulfide interchange protein